MQFEVEICYPHSCDTTVKMLGQKDFWELRFPQVCEVDISFEGELQVASLLLETNRVEIPPQAKKFINGNASLIVRETLGPRNSDGSYPIWVDIAAHKLPVTFKAQGQLIAQGSQCKRIMECELHVSVPFFGRKIEQKILGNISKITDHEVAAARKWQP